METRSTRSSSVWPDLIYAEKFFTWTSLILFWKNGSSKECFWFFYRQLFVRELHYQQLRFYRIAPLIMTAHPARNPVVPAGWKEQGCIPLVSDFPPIHFLRAWQWRIRRIRIYTRPPPIRSTIQRSPGSLFFYCLGFYLFFCHLYVLCCFLVFSWVWGSILAWPDLFCNGCPTAYRCACPLAKDPFAMPSFRHQTHSRELKKQVKQSKKEGFANEKETEEGHHPKPQI